MSKFSIGQQVRIVSGSILCSRALVGRVGTVDRYDSSDDTYALRLPGGDTVWAKESQLAAVAETPATGIADHKFNVGDKGSTKDGTDFVVVARKPDDSGEYPLIVRVSGVLEEYTEKGGYFNHRSDDRDLVAPKKTVDIYLNITASGTVTGSYSDEDQARRMASPAAVIVAHPVTVEIPA